MEVFITNFFIYRFIIVFPLSEYNYRNSNCLQDIQNFVQWTADFFKI